LPKDLAHQHVHKVFLTLFSEMVHRFLFRHREEPYRSCGVVSHEPTEEQFERACDTPACCRRSSLALVQYSNVDSPGSTRFSRYKVAFSEWCLRVVPVTIPVEKMHAEQRNRSRKWSRKPVSFARQSCAEVVQHLQKLWTARGGRDLHILDAAYDKDLVAGKRSTGPAFARPKQTGNPSFSWITTQMTYRELCARCRVCECVCVCVSLCLCLCVRVNMRFSLECMFNHLLAFRAGPAGLVGFHAKSATGVVRCDLLRHCLPVD
jgi:hypothetical protein